MSFLADDLWDTPPKQEGGGVSASDLWGDSPVQPTPKKKEAVTASDLWDDAPEQPSLIKKKVVTASTIGSPNTGPISDKSVAQMIYDKGKREYKTFQDSPEVQKFGPNMGGTVQAARGILTAPVRLGQGLLKAAAGAVEAITGDPLDDSTMLGAATSRDALSYRPFDANSDRTPPTIFEQGGQAAGDAALMSLEGGAVAGQGLSKIPAMIRTGSYYGGKQGLGAYDTALRSGLTKEQALKYAAAHGAIGAGTAFLPLANVAEGGTGTILEKMLGPGLAGKVAPEAIKRVGGKIAGSVVEAEALNTLNNMAERNIDPDRSLWDQSEILPMLGQVVGMKVLGHQIEARTATKPVTVTELLNGDVGTLGLPAPIEVGTGVPKSQRSRITGRAETQVRGGARGDDAIVNQVLKAIEEIPPEVRTELRDHYAAQDARTAVPEGTKAPLPEVRPLSPEAQKYAPLLDKLNKGFYESYATLARSRGDEPADFNQWHITRPVTEGIPEPGQTVAGTSPMKSTSGSQNSRSRFAYREVGNPNGEVRISEDLGPEMMSKGKRFIRTEATPTEIESQTGLKYSPDPFAAILEGHRDTNRAIRSRDFRAKLAQSDLSAPTGQAPEGWQAPSRAVLDAMPEFEGRAVSPLLYNSLNRMVVGEPKMGAFAKAVDQTRRVLTGAIFGNPTAHVFNQVPHFLGAYGTKDVLTGKFMGDLDWGMRQVRDLQAGRVSPEVQKFLEGGTSFMSKPETADSGATALNLANAVGRVAPSSGQAEVTGAMGALNRMNRDYTWTLDDAFRLALMKKYSRDMPKATPRQVADEVSSYFPDYQKGEMEPMGGMVHGKTAKNTLMFNTFGSQSIEATSNTVKNIVKSPGKFLGEVGGLGAAVGLGKLATKAYQGLTQDDETEVRVGGTIHVLDKLFHATKGGPGNAAKEISGMVHFNPIVKGLLSAGFQLTDPSFGQKIGENQEDAALYRRYLKDGEYAKASEVYTKMSGDFGQAVADSMVPFGKEIKSLKKGETLPDTVTKMLMGGRKIKDDATDILLGNVLARAYSPYPAPYTDREKVEAKVKVNQMVKSSDSEGVLKLATSGVISPAQAKAALMRMGGDKNTRIAGLIKQADVMAAVLGYRELEPDQQAALKSSIQAKVGASFKAAKTDSDRKRAMEAARLIGLKVPDYVTPTMEDQP